MKFRVLPLKLQKMKIIEKLKNIDNSQDWKSIIDNSQLDSKLTFHENLINISEQYHIERFLI